MSVMDFFRGKQPEPAPAAPANAQAGTPQEPNLSQLGSGQPPQPNPPGATGEPGPTGFDQFKDLFAPATPEQIASQGNFDPNSLFASLEPAKVHEAVGKMNFTDGISADQLSAIAAGGEGAVQALVAVINQTNQKTMASAVLGNAEMIKQAMATVNGGLDARVNAAARKQAIGNTISEANPIYSNPAAKPMVDALAYTLATKNPTATPQEIQKSVEAYFTQLAQAITPQSQAGTQQQTNETDWSKFLN